MAHRLGNRQTAQCILVCHIEKLTCGWLGLVSKGIIHIDENQTFDMASISQNMAIEGVRFG